MSDLIDRQALLEAIDSNRKRLIELDMLGAEDILVHWGRRLVEESESVDPEWQASYQQVSKALCGKEDATLEEMLEAVKQVKQEKKGHWTLHGNDDDLGSSYFCSECFSCVPEDWFYPFWYANGQADEHQLPFCPYCGSRMKTD